jgi:predicted enzyme related to lactoylglutathione lyase
MLHDSKAFSGFSTNDLAATRQFYAESLGLDVTEEGGMLTLHLNGGGTVMIYPKETHQPATFTVLNFPVSDIDAIVDDLIAKGMTMARYDGMNQDEKGIMRGSQVQMGPDIAWFTDPGGNIIAVMQTD